MATGQGLSLLEERLMARMATDEGVTFDPLIILTIISALIPLIQGCLNPTPKSLRIRFLNRARLAIALKRELSSGSPGGASWAAAFARADMLLDLAGEAKDEELQLLIEDCK